MKSVEFVQEDQIMMFMSYRKYFFTVLGCRSSTLCTNCSRSHTSWLPGMARCGKHRAIPSQRCTPGCAVANLPVHRQWCRSTRGWEGAASRTPWWVAGYWQPAKERRI